MADELIDIYNENNKPLSLSKMKSEAHKKGLWHRAAHIWIYNHKGEILLQLRSQEKDLYPNKWDVSVAGHVSAGEEPITSAIREIKEEIGLSVEAKDLDFIKIRKAEVFFENIINKEFYYIYFMKFDGNVNELILQEEEVSDVRFLSINKVQEELKKYPDKYATHGNYWLEELNEIKSII